MTTSEQGVRLPDGPWSDAGSRGNVATGPESYWRGREAATAVRTSTRGLRQTRGTFDGLPPAVFEVHVLQQKTSWSAADHARIVELTHNWTSAQRLRYEQQWNWGRPARWR